MDSAIHLSYNRALNDIVDNIARVMLLIILNNVGSRMLNVVFINYECTKDDGLLPMSPHRGAHHQWKFTTANLLATNGLNEQ